MWSNFKAMPLFMKLLTLHGSMFFVGAITSLFSIGGFSIAGKEVTYKEWWSSGEGIEFFLVSMGMGLGAICLLLKYRYARIVYFGAWSGIIFSMIISDPALLGRPEWVITLVLFLSLIYWYFFHKKTVQLYFGAGNL